MSGKLVALFLLAAMLIAGAGMYYLQVWGYYTRLPAQDRVMIAGAPVPATRFEGIDAQSSPLRYRACFTLAPGALADLPTHPAPTPLNAPFWFSCFDAARITADLEAGTARAVLAQSVGGIDRLVALYPDGRAFEWPQLGPEFDEKKVIE